MDEKYKILDKYPGPFSTSTSPSDTNQLKQLLEKTRAGYTGVEIQAISFSGTQGSWASIPKQIFEEIARNAYLNNIQLSIHAPIRDLQLPGIYVTERGPVFSEEERKRNADFRLFSVLAAAGEMAKIYGKSIRINVHASDIPITSWEKGWEIKVKSYLRNNPEKFEDLKQKLYYLGIIKKEDLDKIKDPDQLPSWVFAKREGIIIPIDPNFNRAEIFSLESKEMGPLFEKGIKTVVDEIYERNIEYWNRILHDLYSFVNSAKNYLQTLAQEAANALYDPNKVGLFYSAYSILYNYFDRLRETVNDIYNYVEKFGNEEQKKYLSKIKEKTKEIEEYYNKFKELKKELDNLRKISAEKAYEEYQKHAKYIFNELFGNTYYNIKTVEDSLNEIGKLTMLCGPVSILKPAQEFSIEKGAETIAESYKKYLEYVKNNLKDFLTDPKKLDIILPEMVIEHSYAGSPGSRPDLWIKYIEKAREKLKEVINQYPDIKKLIEKAYGSVEDFVKEKIAGTIDVAHMRFYEQYGYSKGDILKWIREMKPYIKHIHLSESQWSEDTHLPFGLGWDDLTRLELEELKDKLAEKGVYIVHEPGGWYTTGFSNQFGGELPYTLHYGGFSPYMNLSYEEALFKPEYFLGMPMYTPAYTPGITITRYSPIAESFSGLPPMLGGKKVQTFSGEKLE